MNVIYLDNSATTPVCKEAVGAVTKAMTEGFYNPSSLYDQGVFTRKKVEECRVQIQDALRADQVVFTAGGTEADNLAILGRKRIKGKRVLYSAGEHSAVRVACDSLEEICTVVKIPLLENGLIDLDALSKEMKQDTALICVMQVNNETGAIQPLSEVENLRDSLCPQAAIHVDGVQGFLRQTYQLAKPQDSYALSAHKVHGPKGVGALAMGSKAGITPMLLGGGQESGIRSGTENTPGIAGLQAAIASFPKDHRMRELKIKLYKGLQQRIPLLAYNGPDPESAQASDHIINLSFPPVKAETLMHTLEGKGIYVSQGSACSSRKKTSSSTLAAMGLPMERRESALRFSLSPYTTSEEIEQAISCAVDAYQDLARFVRR